MVGDLETSVYNKWMYVCGAQSGWGRIWWLYSWNLKGQGVFNKYMAEASLRGGGVRIRNKRTLMKDGFEKIFYSKSIMLTRPWNICICIPWGSSGEWGPSPWRAPARPTPAFRPRGQSYTQSDTYSHISPISCYISYLEVS